MDPVVRLERTDLSDMENFDLNKLDPMNATTLESSQDILLTESSMDNTKAFDESLDD